MKRIVAFVGPLPPPTNGFSNVCAFMLAKLSGIAEVRIYDRSPLPTRPLRTLARQLMQACRFAALCIGSRDCVLYLGLSGGMGQLADGLYLIACNMVGYPKVVHHHSFAYLDSPSMLNRLIFSLARDAEHIALSEGMRERLASTYALDENRIRVISNAAIDETTCSRVALAATSTGPIRIGFLSNITFEKGFVEFFDVLSGLGARNVDYRAFIAGPIADEARHSFFGRLEETQNVAYLGALYGVHKARFYDDLDVFLLPTKYENEAEPLVIHEAWRHGVCVLATNRGAIAELLSDGGGSVYSDEEFVESCVFRIEQWADDRQLLFALRKRSSERGTAMRARAASQLQSFLSWMARADPMAGEVLK